MICKLKADRTFRSGIWRVDFNIYSLVQSTFQHKEFNNLTLLLWSALFCFRVNCHGQIFQKEPILYNNLARSHLKWSCDLPACSSQLLRTSRRAGGLRNLSAGILKLGLSYKKGGCVHWTPPDTVLCHCFLSFRVFVPGWSINRLNSA